MKKFMSKDGNTRRIGEQCKQGHGLAALENYQVLLEQWFAKLSVVSKMFYNILSLQIVLTQ